MQLLQDYQKIIKDRLKRKKMIYLVLYIKTINTGKANYNEEEDHTLLYIFYFGVTHIYHNLVLFFLSIFKKVQALEKSGQKLYI